MSFLTGTPGKYRQLSTLGKEQQPLYGQLLSSARGQTGAGGGFGQASDYYSSLLNDNNSTFNAFAAPEQRRFKEEIIPSLAEQFAGMGSGGLQSSGFQNAAVNAGTDLSERLGALRAQLREQGAQGLMNLGKLGLGQYNENIYEQPQPGFLQAIAPGIGQALGGFGTTGAFNSLGKAFSSIFGKSSPYGQQKNTR